MINRQSGNSTMCAADQRAAATHTLLINDEREECGSVTTWAFPKGLPQSMGMAVETTIQAPQGELEGLPVASIYANHREALKVYLSEGRLLVDLKGLSLDYDAATGLYQLML